MRLLPKKYWHRNLREKVVAVPARYRTVTKKILVSEGTERLIKTPGSVQNRETEGVGSTSSNRVEKDSYVEGIEWNNPVLKLFMFSCIIPPYITKISLQSDDG